MEDTDFKGAKFQKVTFIKANMKDCRMNADTRMWWCDFRGADLSRAKLKGVQFKDCVYNSKTKFPKGYTPKAGEWKKAAN